MLSSLTQSILTSRADSFSRLGLIMNTEKNSVTPETAKRAYEAPDLVQFGSAKEITQNVNQLGGGDAQFSLLRHS
jgi:hypothetical protein